MSLSDALAKRCDLEVNVYAESTHWRNGWRTLDCPFSYGAGTRRAFRGRIWPISEIQIADLAPFCLSSLDGLLDAPFGATTLCRRPLIREGDGIHLPVASLVSPALRLHLTHAIADGVVPVQAIETFHKDQFARWVMVDLALRKAKPLEMAALDLPSPDLDVPGVTQAVLRFDQDKLLHILVLECDWQHPPECAIHETRTSPAKLEKALADYLRLIQEKLAMDTATTRGLTLVIQGFAGLERQCSTSQRLQ